MPAGSSSDTQEGIVPGQVTFEWLGTGFGSKTGYRPQRAELLAEKPANVTRMPEGLTNPMYAVLPFGPPDAEQKAVLILEETGPGQSRLWVDSNGNGDLTDDPPPTWRALIPQGPNSRTTGSGSARLTVNLGGQAREIGLNLYRLTNIPTAIMYYRDFGMAGKLVIAGKSYTSCLSDDKARGDFLNSGDAALLVDLNEDGKFDWRFERFPTREPFNIRGTTYEITGLAPGSTTFQIIKSAQTVAEKAVPPPTPTTNQTAPAFDDKTLDGAPVRFPADYRGKLVMLDFWATWCPPCVAELPNLTQVYADLHPRGFEILGISLDRAETVPTLKKYTAGKNMPWPQIADGKMWEARIGQLYSIRSIPSAFLVDGSTGRILASGQELRGSALRGSVERALSSLPKTAPIPDDPRLAQILAAYQSRYENEVQQPHLAAVTALTQSYVANGITRARATAIEMGSLDEVKALDAEKAALQSGKGVPSTDSADTPSGLRTLRAVYRGALAKLESDRSKKARPLYDSQLSALDAYFNELTRAGKPADAAKVKACRDDIAARRAALASN